MLVCISVYLFICLFVVAVLALFVRSCNQSRSCCRVELLPANVSFFILFTYSIVCERGSKLIKITMSSCIVVVGGIGSSLLFVIVRND